MKQFFKRNAGIIGAVVYGLLARILFDWLAGSDFAGLSSITFVFGVPVIIGIIPMLFASKELLSKTSYTIGTPMLAVCLFLVVCCVARLEDLLCAIIIGIPFILAAGLGGYLVAYLVLRYRKRKGIMYSVMLLPFLTGVVEQQLPTPSRTFEVHTSVVINNTPEQIWEQVVRVKPIDESEYNKGFFNYAGIPRPLYAELDKDTLGATRIGHFEGGLQFRETVTQWHRNKQVAFNIAVIPSSIGSTVFDKHILKGQHFKFLNASYTLKPLNDRQTELILSSAYQLDTKVHAYGAFWGNQLLTDFQERLLEVIKRRCDKWE